MSASHGPGPRRFFAPEVIQTSMMDCGPAALKSVLEGFGIETSYEELRERCQTDVDGTSLDHLAALARDYGLTADEMVVPEDSLLLPEAECLPAVAIVRAPNRAWHFVVVWRTAGSLVQVMDPAGGRRWVARSTFLEGIPQFPTPITAARWRAWAKTDDFVAPLRAKLRGLGVGRREAATLLAGAEDDATWLGLGALDAAARMARHLVEGGAIRRGADASRLLGRLCASVAAGDRRPTEIIPRSFWWVSPGAAPDKLTVTGPLIVHFSRAKASRAKLVPAAGEPDDADATIRWVRPPSFEPAQADARRALPDQMRARLEESRVSPLRIFAQLARADAPRALVPVLVALVASAATATFEVFLLRSVFDIDQYLGLTYQRSAAAIALATFALGGTVLDVAIARALSRLGTALEVRFRAAFLEKLPRLEDGYLRSRPTADMTSRAHAMHLVREVPQLGGRILRSLLGFACAIGVVAWLYPHGLRLALVAAGSSMAASYALRMILAESTARRRALGAGLEQFYLDALRGVVPIRAHGAERAVRREHEELLVSWVRAGRAVQTQVTLLQALQLVVGTATTLLLVAGYVSSGESLAQLLVLVYFALRLPASGQELVSALTEWASLRNVALRLLAPLAAREAVVEAPPRDPGERAPGVRLRFAGVTVREAGHTILRDVSLEIAPGSLVAIVGSSGAGKSSLLGVLLGWLAVAEGGVRVDGRPLDAEERVRLREQTAWVDPGIHLWNGTVLENVAFGESEEAFARMGDVIASSDLADVLERLPDALQSSVGEGGTRVSAGQGQRIRLARAMMRRSARLVLLDEPFRGLDRERRRKLLAQARRHWAGATILFVSHDVSDTLACDRALVVEGGRVVEDGAPRELAARPRSRFAALAGADAELNRSAWSSSVWQRKRFEGGGVVDAAADGGRGAR